MSVQASLYIHIPFCSSFCDYCDFYSVAAGSFNDDYIDAFLSALIADIKRQIDYFSVIEIPSAYIGGGTPSVLGGKISRLLNALKDIPAFSPAEFTIEANPESAAEEFLGACREGGINRLSIGVQTFHAPSRSAVNRGNSLSINKDTIEDRLALVSRYFPDAFSVDLITGLPFQTEQTVIEDINKTLEFNPAHISLYSLSVESGTALEEKVKTKDIILPGEDIADYLWLTGRGTLIKKGFEHYEISNFARTGKRCLHNIRYWQMAGWLGAGPAASGTIAADNKEQTAMRFTFAPDIDKYINEPSILKAEYEKLDRTALLKDTLLMGFRYIDGPDSKLFRQRFGCAVEDCIPGTLAQWEGKDKMLFLNQFLSDAFAELVSCNIRASNINPH